MDLPPTICGQSSYWWLTETEIKGWLFIAAGPKPETGKDSSKSFLQIKKPGGLLRGYKFVYCGGDKSCYEFGMVVDRYGYSRLAPSNLPFRFVFMNMEKLMKMANTVRTGGKGTVRRKKKAVHKTNTTDDKKLQSTLKRVGVNSIPGIEEVNIFKDDVVIQFINPKVQASSAANTWAVSGTPQTKRPDNLHNLKKLAEQFQKQAPGGADVPATIQEEDDDDVPELVVGETFETPAAEEASQPKAAAS
ncbi:hypothetical protein Bca4012_050195 [Brassica carinata]